MLLPPGVGCHVMMDSEDAAKIAAAGKPALSGDGVELEVREGQQPHGPFEAQSGECGLRAFATDVPKEPAQVADGNADGLGDLIELRLFGHVVAVPSEAVEDLLQRVIDSVLIRGKECFRQRDQGKFEQGFLEEHQTFFGHAPIGGPQFRVDLFKAPHLIGDQRAYEIAALADGFFKQGRHLAEVEYGDLAATHAFSTPTVRYFRGKDPEMMLLKRRLFSFGEQGPTLAAKHGEELPVVTLVNVHRVQPEATRADGHVAQHSTIVPQMAEFVKRSTCR